MLISHLSIFYTNANQFLNKIDDLEMLIAGSEPDIIMITEVLPKIHCNSISAARLALSGYQAFFNFDPNNPSSTDHLHGVTIYIYSKLPASEVFLRTNLVNTKIKRS